MLTLAAAAFASSAMLRACDPLLPVLARDFGVDVARASQTVSWYALTYGLLQLLYGPLADRHGKRRVIGYAAIGCTVGNVLAVFATTLDALVVARVVAAACSAGIIPLVLAWVGDTVPIAQRQLVLAIPPSGPRRAAGRARARTTWRTCSPCCASRWRASCWSR